jgi:hypothetical protein
VQFPAARTERSHRLQRTRSLCWRIALVLALAPASAASQERAAADIVRDLDRVQFPSFSRGSSPEALAEFERTIREASETVARLALELDRAHPDHPRVPEALGDRWALMTNALGRADEVVDEIGDRLPREERPSVRAEAQVARAWAAAHVEAVPLAKAREWVDAAEAARPGDERCAMALLRLAKQRSILPAEQGALIDRVIESYPRAAWAAPEARAARRALERRGEPLELAFVDALSGRDVSLRDLRGRTVVVHV